MDKEKIRVLIVEPEKPPYFEEIDNDYRAMQSIVGGDIEYFPLDNEGCHLYCHGEGKLIGLPGNRRMDNGDIISGTFLISGDNGGDDCSLTDEQIAYYSERFGLPEFYTTVEANEMRSMFIPCAL